MFYSISRLANTEKGLSFQAMRKLYIACVVSIADYGVPVWWKKQVSLLDKFNKLQNAALRKMLGAFKTSPIAAMEVEAGILPTAVRFEKLCKNYALKILQMQDSHPVKRRVPANSPFNQIDGVNMSELNSYLNINSADLANWNQNLSESESEPEYFGTKRKKKKKSRKKKKHASQLFRLCSYLKELIDSKTEVESFDFSLNSPWKKSVILTEIDSNEKKKAAENHREKITNLQQNHHENIIIYSDDSKVSESQIGAESYISYFLEKQQTYS